MLPKILAKKLNFCAFLFTISGIASVSHPSLIIIRAPKHDVKFVSNSLLSPFLSALSNLLTFEPKKFKQYFSKLNSFDPPPVIKSFVPRVGLNSVVIICLFIIGLRIKPKKGSAEEVEMA